MSGAEHPDDLRREVMLCRRQWRLHWHARRHPDPAVRAEGRAERRWWAMCLVRARTMLRTNLTMQVA